MICKKIKNQKTNLKKVKLQKYTVLNNSNNYLNYQFKPNEVTFFYHSIRCIKIWCGCKFKYLMVLKNLE